MLTMVVYAVFGIVLFVVYLSAMLILYYKYDELNAYRTEIVGTALNGIIGTVGIVVYGLNIPITGQVATMTELIDRPCTQPDCDAAFSCLIAFSLCSTLRFVCWYAEFVVSFSFLVIYRHNPWCAIPLRYAFHSLNVILSAVTFGLSVSYVFPSGMVFGSEGFPPVVVQSLLLVMSFMSFWFITRSPLYRVRWIVDDRFIARY